MKGQRIGLGRTAEIYAWGKDRVLKLFWEDWSASSVEYEFRISKIVVDAGLPVPGVEEIIAVDSRLGIIYERVEGQDMLRTMLSDLFTIHKYADMLAELHSEMHTLRVLNLPSLRRRLENKIRAASPLPAELRSLALEILNELPDGDILCHGDFHPENILMSPKGPVIIDWCDATKGNPLADVARTSMLVQIGEPPDPPRREIAQAIRQGYNSRYLERYFQLRPGSQEELATWYIPVAAGRFSEGITEENERLMTFLRANAPQ